MTATQTGVLGLDVFGTLIELGHRPFAHLTRKMSPQKVDLTLPLTDRGET